MVFACAGARHDPEFGRDVHGRELRLGQPHPVLLRHLGHAQRAAAFKEILSLQQASGLLGGSLGGEQRDHAGALPAFGRRRHAGLAKQGLLSLGLGVGVLDADAQGIQRIQRLAQDLHAILRTEQTKFMHNVPRGSSHGLPWSRLRRATGSVPPQAGERRVSASGGYLL